jgi:tetratricopeptide (TPR) repeat protein
LSESGESLPAISAQRQTEPAKLTRLVRGELDWIVMKALEKDRNRRYETANGFAVDVQRYLANEPVQACPPSAWYRLRKLVRRNRAAVVAGALIVATLAVGTVVSSWQAVVATQARDAERQARTDLDASRDETDRQRARVNRKLGDALAESLRLREKARAAGRDVRAWGQFREALRRAEALAGGELADPALASRVAGLRAELEREEVDRWMVERLEQIRLGGNRRLSAMEQSKAYAKVFEEYGLKGEMGADEWVRRIAASPIRVALLEGLDNWANEFFSKDVLAVAQQADADPWRRRYRDALLRKDHTALLQLAREPAALDQPPGNLVLLANKLAFGRGDPETATEILQQAQFRQTATEILQQAQLRHPGDLWINLTLTHVYLNVKPPRPADAVACCRAALAVRPDSPEIWCTLGWCLNSSGQFNEAAAVARRAILIDGRNYQNYHCLGDSLRRSQDLNDGEKETLDRGDNPSLSEAATAYRRAIELVSEAPDPKPFPLNDLYGELAQVLWRNGHLDAALAAGRAALRFPGRGNNSMYPFNAHFTVGLALIEKGNEKEALASFEAARRADPYRGKHLPSGLFNVAWKLPRAEHQVAACSLCLRMDPDKPGYLAYRGLGYARLGQHTLALADLDRAIRLNPASASAHKIRAAVYQMLGKLVEAAADMSRVVELTPEDHAAINDLAWLLATSPQAAVRNPTRAVELARRATGLQPEVRAYWHTLGVCHYRAAGWQASIDALARSAELHKGGDGFDWFFLAMAHHKLGHSDEARKWYERAAGWLARNSPFLEKIPSQAAEIRRFREEAEQTLGLKKN